MRLLEIVQQYLDTNEFSTYVDEQFWSGKLVNADKVINYVLMINPSMRDHRPSDEEWLKIYDEIETAWRVAEKGLS
jgi:hypothetical protein